VQLAIPALDPIGFLDLGEAAPPVIQAAQLGVEIGQLKQPQLRLGRCFHGSPR
jgi:hypothetical protein